MARITEKEARHVALLGRLKLSDEEINRYTEDLNKILEYVEKINELNVTNVEPTSHSLKMSNVFRSDVVKPSFTPEQSLKNAPDKEDDCFKVPKILQ